MLPGRGRTRARNRVNLLSARPGTPAQKRPHPQKRAITFAAHRTGLADSIGVILQRDAAKSRTRMAADLGGRQAALVGRSHRGPGPASRNERSAPGITRRNRFLAGSTQVMAACARMVILR